MNRLVALVAVIGATTGPRCVRAGDITGTVKLEGKPPDELSYAKTADAVCATHGAEGKTRHFVVGPSGEFANVVVWVQGMGGKGSPGSSGPTVVLDQKDCEYVPVIMAVQTGQKIMVKNSDPTTHNVHANPTADSGNKGFNQLQPANTPDLVLTFDKPEMFLKMTCEVHNWMFAWVSVFDHPYFAVSAKDGTFKISSLPPGKYTIMAQHRKANDGKPISQEIEIKDGAPNKVEFTMVPPGTKKG